MNRTLVSLPVAGGDTCPTLIFSPTMPGTYPALIIAIDGFGVRPALEQMAGSIAARGAVVALPDLYHRAGNIMDLMPVGTVANTKALVGKIFSDDDLRTRWRERFYASAVHPAHIEADFTSVLDCLAQRSDVRTDGGVGITGYCMGGNIALRVAARFGERIAFAASFHGGNLVTDAADSPHLGAGSITARVYVAGALEDASFTDDACAKLAAAFDAAKLRYEIETYQARHGFCVPDMPTYDTAAAARHDTVLGQLLGLPA
jgi:carboxymethylenebutenolidase